MTLVFWTVSLPAQERREFRELHMGVEVRIVLYAADEPQARSAARAAFARIAELEDIMSDYRSESELRRLERRAGEWGSVSEPLFHILTRSVEIAASTNGAFDPTVGPIVALWRESRRTRRFPDPRMLDSARALVDWRRIELDSSGRRVRLATAGMRLDLGGIAKGYILQQAIETLRHRSIPSSLIEGGGDIALGDAPPGTTGWKITLPESAVALANVSIATSGPQSQFVEIAGKRYSHIVDPRTGLGLTNNLSATVIATDGALADALATALTVSDAAAAARLQKRYPAVRGVMRRSGGHGLPPAR
jgi:thiamine biosynthesis lipoprotein